MKKHTSQEAYYERLKNLAEVNKVSIKESLNRSLGTLIDYKRAADGIAYGIIKENHSYYIKKSGTKPDPNVSDFAYIGGLQNITDYQYKSLAEADKHRNMLFHTINEAVTLKPNINGSKKRLNEDKAGEEIEMASSKIDDLDMATDAVDSASPETNPEETLPVDTEMQTDATSSDEIPTEEPASPDGEAPTDEPVPTDGEEPIGDDGETDSSADGEALTPDDEKSLSVKEIEKLLGKVTNKVRNIELTDSQVKSYVNSFLSAFRDKFPDVEIEDRKEMANKILKIVPDVDIDTLDVGDESQEEVDEASTCSECGGFTKYAESRGYTKESIMECGEEEMSSLVGGYANAYADGENEGDHKTVALFVKLMPKILDILKNEYGHDEYADELESEVNSVDNEPDAIQAQIDEAWGGALLGGLKSVGKGIGQAVAAPVKSAYNAGKDAVGQVGQAVQKGMENVKQSAQAASQAQDIRTGTKKRNTYLDKVQAKATELANLIQQANAGAEMAKQDPIKVQSVLSTITNQLKKNGGVDLSRYKAEGFDPANTETQPNILDTINEDDELEIDTNEISDNDVVDTPFAPAAQSLGVATVKPDGAPTTAVDVNVNADSKTISVTMSESERKLRNYVRIKLDEMVGKRKPILMEGKKSESLMKLDKMIENQFKLYKSMKEGKVEFNEEKLKKYINNRVQEKFTKKTSPINESKKSASLKRIDKMIDEELSIQKKKI